jgi:peptidoglycan/LPS O-acetylase OafA/YrhL
MARIFLLLLLFIALVVELALAVAAWAAPAFLLQKFGVHYTPDTAFMGYVLGWLLLFVSLVAGVALVQVWQRRPHFATLCYVLGFWWISIGIGIYLAFGKTDNLLLDSLKGLLLIVLTRICQVTRMTARRY